jgi:hypothetical protein
MDKLSKEELLKLIATSEKPKKARKKPDLDEEKKLAMLERLANMRETVKKNREAKKTVETPAIKEKDIDEVFEKKYGTKFDKMNELLTDLNENTKEVVKLKREKAAKREIKPEPEPEKPAPLAKAAPPAPVVPPPARLPFPIPNQFVNPNVHRKGSTRF